MRVGNLIVVLCLTATGGVALEAGGESLSGGWQAPPRAARRANPVPLDDRSLADGRAVYQHQCLSCHGAGGHGDGKDAADLTPTPSDLCDGSVAQQSDGALFWKITQGRKPMPSFEKLASETQRWEVIHYIRTLSRVAPASTRP